MKRRSVFKNGLFAVIGAMLMSDIFEPKKVEIKELVPISEIKEFGGMGLRVLPKGNDWNHALLEMGKMDNEELKKGLFAARERWAYGLTGGNGSTRIYDILKVNRATEVQGANPERKKVREILLTGLQ